MDLERKQALIKNLKNEMLGIRQRIDEERNSAKKTEMIKTYRVMSELLNGNARP